MKVTNLASAPVDVLLFYRPGQWGDSKAIDKQVRDELNRREKEGGRITWRGPLENSEGWMPDIKAK